MKKDLIEINKKIRNVLDMYNYLDYGHYKNKVLEDELIEYLNVLKLEKQYIKSS